ncbi:probable E3 ubiquitin-protein ligase RHC1A [Miscanthus floridulus]|uniref:probable E3 ubiquitin-protein ligase RHC1A n=1 Tax=Miscanthus floridulus TaxID=154761 RepID=UPI0034591D46
MGRFTSDAQATGAAACTVAAATPRGRLLRLPQDGVPARSRDGCGARRTQTRHQSTGGGVISQTVHGEHALAPGARRQRGRTGSAAAVALESTAARDARGEAEEDASAPSSEASSVLCAVCLEEVRGRRAAAAEAEAITLPCSHAYHPGCVLPWLAVHRACPCCRATVPSPEN